MTTSTLSNLSDELEAFDAFLGCWNYNTQMHLWRYVFAGKYVRNKVVLDIACGVGYGTHHLAERGAKKVFGVDLDSAALKFASDSYSSHNTKYILGNGLCLPFNDDSIDIVVSFETIEHIPIEYQEDFIAEIHRVIKPKGMFLCSSINHEFSPGHVDHTREFLPKELFSLVSKYFGQVLEYGQFINANDLSFQNIQTKRIGFKLKRKRAIYLRKIRKWFMANPQRMYFRNLIKQSLGMKNRSNIVRDPVYLSDTLINDLDPQYAPLLLPANNDGILFCPIAIGLK